MKPILLKIIGLLTLSALLVSACAPAGLERTPVPAGQESAGEAAGPAGAANPGLEVKAGVEGNPAAGLEVRPTDPICPTPTPELGVTEGAQEGTTEEGVQAPAGPAESVSGATTGGYPSPESLNQLLDRVNQGPGVSRGGETSLSAYPEPGGQTVVGDASEEGTGESVQGSAGGVTGFLSAFLESVIGTPQAGSYEPRPSPTPCP